MHGCHIHQLRPLPCTCWNDRLLLVATEAAVAQESRPEASHHVLTSLAAFQFAACRCGVQAEEVENAEAMAEEGLASAGKGPKPPAAGGAAGQPPCSCIAKCIYLLCICNICTACTYAIY